MTQHELKTDPSAFDALWDEIKSYELRKNDRKFKVGDILDLRDFDAELGTYGGRWIIAEVTHMTPGGKYGLPTWLCCMSIRILSKHLASEKRP